MSQQEPQAAETKKAASPEQVRNPYIVNFCKVLVEKKELNLEQAAQKKLINDMYKLFEYMLGQNMIGVLPDEVRAKYMAMSEDLSNLDYEKIGEIFDPNVPNYQEVMKQTMKQFAEIFLKNADFNPKDYPVSFAEKKQKNDPGTTE